MWGFSILSGHEQLFNKITQDQCSLVWELPIAILQAIFLYSLTILTSFDTVLCIVQHIFMAKDASQAKRSL